MSIRIKVKAFTKVRRSYKLSLFFLSDLLLFIVYAFMILVFIETFDKIKF